MPRHHINFATINPHARRRIEPFRRHAYELQNADGAVLTGHETVEALLRNLVDKTGVCRIVRTRDDVVVHESKGER